jgi:hypothetical protein
MTYGAALSADTAQARDAQPQSTGVRILRPQQALTLPIAATLGLLAVSFLPGIRANPRLFLSFWGAAAALLAWNAVLLGLAIRGRRILALEIVLRKQHYLQACAQGSVLLYWGWHWRQVYDSAPLIAAQILFAYAFDMLLAWSRRDRYTLGFGPFPVIFSINLFLWFKHDWFYLQFLMVAVGFAAKELIRWNREGRRVHIFNPSSFPLSIFSLGLIATRSTNITWGQEIANTQLLPPYIYVFLFLIGLPGQFFFGVTTMTMSAVVTTYAFGLLYFAATGVYYFFDSYVPIAVFLGMHLLFTDPSTSPRTELGRITFGMLYGLSVIGCYALLKAAGVPSFYDKLLPVPLLNLSVTLIDAAARSSVLRRFDPAALGRTLLPRRRNLAYIGGWTLVFLVMSAANGVGDNHPGHWIPFWQEACREGRRDGCQNLALMEATYCKAGSGWACNEYGVMLARGGHSAVGARSLSSDGNEFFTRACNLGFGPGCDNLRTVGAGSGSLRSGPPRIEDYQIVLLHGKGPLPDRTSLELFERACRQGFMAGCENAATLYLRGEGTPRDPARAAYEFDKACNGGNPTACSNLGLMYRNGDGVARDDERALASMQKGCDLGMASACRWVEDKRR